MNPKSADKPGSVTAHANVRYDRHSSRRTVADALEPPTRGLGEQPVLPNARPLTWCCSGWRLPRFTRLPVTGGDSSLWPCSSPSSAALTATYSVRELPGILLCGARTFLPPYRFHGPGGDGLAGFGPLVYCDLRRGVSCGRIRAVRLPPARAAVREEQRRCGPISTSRSTRKCCPSARSRRRWGSPKPRWNCTD